ncbi:alpha-(1,3)-fucosyltransferase 10 isoform X3 [Tupaia chinensis]|uniref:alpha-(1,3)-fucosyltransferase 10 isoform X3 n=1 Tax=Tupaia chinensis TaxID=246437 RepID=UPI000FFB2626|nr:alpha-(1,3)-fucosyltransferase 10 isoform X3 [Tupaia chinensis]
MVRVRRKKLLASCLCITAAIFLLATLQVAIELGRFHKKMFKVSGLQGGLTETGGGPRHLDAVLRKEVLTWDGLTELGPENVPVMLWWSPLTGDTGRLGQCGADACFFTINRTYLHHPMTKALLFYGLAAPEVEGRSRPPALPGALCVRVLPSGGSAELLAGAVGAQLPAVQARSPGPALAG